MVQKRSSFKISRPLHQLFMIIIDPSPVYFGIKELLTPFKIKQLISHRSGYQQIFNEY
jgi:hypothetical protein